MGELVSELSATCSLRERVIDEYFGKLQEDAAAAPLPPEFWKIHDKADAFIQELRRSWGPAAEPNRANGIVPGRETTANKDDFDSLFALFHKPTVWGFVRLRTTPVKSGGDGFIKLVLGVARDATPQD